MGSNTLVYYAIGVFLLMLIGLVLTVLEFKYGAPKKQSEDNEKKQNGTYENED